MSLAAAFAVLALSGSPAPISDVDVFVGSGGYPHASGMTFPGAAAPFGLVRVSPDGSYGDSWLKGLLYDHLNMGTAGYYPGYTHLLGFSHTRLSGAGVREGGAVRVTPVARDGIPFEHRHETARPGYYRVELPDAGVTVALTAGPHTAVHEYDFGPGTPRRLFIEATSALEPTSVARSGHIALGADGVVAGEAVADGQFSKDLGGAHVAFAVAAEPKPVASEVWHDGARTGIALTFGDSHVTLRVGISLHGEADARANLAAEAPGPFAARLQETERAWGDALGAVAIDADPEVRRRFYTALYHALLMPTLASDVGSAEVARTDLSLWDIYRTQLPLLALVAPEVHRQVVHSILKGTGRFPKWPIPAGDAGCMVGSPATIVVAEAYLKGMRDFDAGSALARMRARDGPAACDELGYCPADEVSESVSRTLEDAMAAGAAARMAAAAGRKDDEAFFAKRAAGFAALWNPGTGMFQAKLRSGAWGEAPPRWMTPFLEALWGGTRTAPYAEGSAAQWRWMPYDDGARLVALQGGPAAFVEALQVFMAGASAERGAFYPGGAYWHGNEHDFHAAYLFNDAGRPDLAQQWVRWALDTRYAATPDGLDGNDDAGAMSAWYVFSALGFYPIAGTTEYWVGSPVVREAEVGRVHVVVHDRGVHVKEVRWNAAPLTTMRLAHDQLVSGGTLEFWMEP